MPYQEQMKGDAMQGTFVQEPEKTHSADAEFPRENMPENSWLYIHKCKSIQTVAGIQIPK